MTLPESLLKALFSSDILFFSEEETNWSNISIIFAIITFCFSTKVLKTLSFQNECLWKYSFFLFMITAFYGDRYGRNPTWTLRRETIVGIVKKRDEFIYPPSFINTVVYFVTCDIRNFRPLKRESHYKYFLYLFHKLID